MNRRTALQVMAAAPWIGSIGRCFDERIKTGFPVLDFNTGGGLKRGGIYLIAGETGAGKSLLSGSIGQNAIQQGHRVATISSDVNHFATGETFTELWLHMARKFDVIIIDGDHPITLAGMKETLRDLNYFVPKYPAPTLIMQALLRPKLSSDKRTEPMAIESVWNVCGHYKYQFANAVFKVKRPSYGGDFNYRCSTIKNRYYPSYATQFLRLDLENKRFTPDALRYPVL